MVQLLEYANVVYVHWAPPCGTGSRARGRPIPKSLKRIGAPEPRPLRSDDFPQGLPGLTPDEQLRVDAANAIYLHYVKFGYILHERGIAQSCENPPNAFLWQCQGVEQLQRDLALEDVDFHSCMWGGQRLRVCRWRASPGMLSDLAVWCDNSHQHLPWTMKRSRDGWSFATAEEAEYPKKLTDQVALLVCSYLQVTPDLNLKFDHSQSGHKEAAVQLGSGGTFGCSTCWLESFAQHYTWGESGQNCDRGYISFSGGISGRGFESETPNGSGRHSTP